MPKYLPSPEAHPERAWLRLREAAQQLGVTEKTVRRWLKAGKLRWKMLQGPNGPEYRLDPEEVRSLSEQIAALSFEPTQRAQSTPGLPSSDESHQKADFYWVKFMEIVAAQSATLQHIAATLERVAEEVRGMRELLERPPERPPWWRRWWRRRRANPSGDEGGDKPRRGSPGDPR